MKYFALLKKQVYLNNSFEKEIKNAFLQTKLRKINKI